jgi:hypothetical protein
MKPIEVVLKGEKGARNNIRRGEFDQIHDYIMNGNITVKLCRAQHSGYQKLGKVELRMGRDWSELQAHRRSKFWCSVTQSMVMVNNHASYTPKY